MTSYSWMMTLQVGHLQLHSPSQVHLQEHIPISNNPIYQVSTYTLSMQMLWTFWFPEHQSELLQRNIIEKTSVVYQWWFWASLQLLSFGYPGGQKSGTWAGNLKIFWWKHQMLIDTCAFLLICSGVVVSSKAQLQTTVEFSKVYYNIHPRWWHRGSSCLLAFLYRKAAHKTQKKLLGFIKENRQTFYSTTARHYCVPLMQVVIS